MFVVTRQSTPRARRRKGQGTVAWQPPPLFDFLNGVHDRIVAAFSGSRTASSSTKGGIREAAFHELASSLPAIARVYRGDIIDREGNHTGQLDGIVVNANSPAVALSGNERIVLAEGALAVFEVKSNLKSQWNQVLLTWDKLNKIRRPPSRTAILAKQFPAEVFEKAFGPAAGVVAEHEVAVAFLVLGWKGWSTHQKLEEKAKELADRFGHGPRPFIFVGQLDPPAFGSIWPSGKPPIQHDDGRVTHHYQLNSWMASSKAERGTVVANVLRALTERVRNAAPMDIDWNTYLGMS